MQLGSPFVCGQAWDEWLSWESSVGKADADCVWRPYNPIDAEIEAEECQRYGKVLRAGTIAVHECCAEIMSVHRRRILRRGNSKDEDLLSDILNGLRRGKRTPVGIDAEGSVYWIFPGCMALYVSDAGMATEYGFRPDSIILKDLYMHDETVVDDDYTASGAVEKANKFGKYDDLANRWWVYETPAEIHAVIHWLSDTGHERILKRSLQQLFPTAASYEHPGPELDKESRELKPSAGPTGLSTSKLGNAGPVMTPLNELSEDSDDDTINEPEAEFEETELWSRPKRGLVEGNHDTDASNDPKFRTNDTVLVLCNRGDLIRDGKVYEVQKISGVYFYNIKFLGCRRPEVLSNWFPENALHRKTMSSQLLQQTHYEKYIKLNAWWAPPVLQTLNALRYTRSSDRAGAGAGLCRGHLTYSDTSSPLALLKAALLTVEAALPLGCVDESDEKWGSDFYEAWRNAVVSSPNASALMECQLSLEFTIKSGWFRPMGSKLLACLPSRAHSAKNATFSLVAIRLWTLDQSLRYEKVILPNGERPAYYQKEKSNRGRKPKGA